MQEYIGLQKKKGIIISGFAGIGKTDFNKYYEVHLVHEDFITICHLRHSGKTGRKFMLIAQKHFAKNIIMFSYQHTMLWLTNSCLEIWSSILSIQKDIAKMKRGRDL